MFVLAASAQVKPNAGPAFARLFREELVPSLHSQRGFRDEMLFVVPGGPEVMFISFWNSREDADAFERAAWPRVVQALADLADRPVLRSFQLAHSTLHAQADATFPGHSLITTEPTGVGA